MILSWQPHTVIAIYITIGYIILLISNSNDESFLSSKTEIKFIGLFAKLAIRIFVFACNYQIDLMTKKFFKWIKLTTLLTFQVLLRFIFLPWIFFLSPFLTFSITFWWINVLEFSLFLFNNWIIFLILFDFNIFLFILTFYVNLTFIFNGVDLWNIFFLLLFIIIYVVFNCFILLNFVHTF